MAAGLTENLKQSSVEPESLTTANQKNLAPHIVLLFVQIMFGSFAIVGKIALREIPSLGLVGLRVGGAAAALWMLRSFINRNETREKLTRGDYLFLAWCSLLGVVLNQFLFITGLSYSTAINATLLGAAIPVWTLIMSFILRREQASARKIIGCLVSIAGVVYLVNPTQNGFHGGTMKGDVLLVLNTACYGTYLAVSQNIIKRIGALNVVVWIFTFACLACVPVGGYQLAGAPLAEISYTTWFAVIYIILIPSVAAYYLNAWALERVVPSTVAAYIYLQPLIAFILAPLVLGERLDSRTGLAALLIFLGVAIVIKRRGRKSESRKSELPTTESLETP